MSQRCYKSRVLCHKPYLESRFNRAKERGRWRIAGAMIDRRAVSWTRQSWRKAVCLPGTRSIEVASLQRTLLRRSRATPRHTCGGGVTKSDGSLLRSFPDPTLSHWTVMSYIGRSQAESEHVRCVDWFVEATSRVVHFGRCSQVRSPRDRTCRSQVCKKPNCNDLAGKTRLPGAADAHPASIDVSSFFSAGSWR
jgi:hypothetical protein